MEVHENQFWSPQSFPAIFSLLRSSLPELQVALGREGKSWLGKAVLDV